MNRLMEDLDKRAKIIQKEAKARMEKEKSIEQEKRRKATEEKKDHDIM